MTVELAMDSCPVERPIMGQEKGSESYLILCRYDAWAPESMSNEDKIPGEACLQLDGDQCEMSIFPFAVFLTI